MSRIDSVRPHYHRALPTTRSDFPRAENVTPDAFEARAAAPAVRDSPYAEQITKLFQDELGRAPTAEELRQYDALAGKVKPEEVGAAFTWVIRSGPEWQALTVCRDELHREPTADELAAAVKWGKELQAQGKSTGELRDAFVFTTRLGPEWQARSAYQELLGRPPSADEQEKMTAWGKELVAQGKSTGDVRAAFNWVIASTPEYQARRTPDRIREEVAQWAVAQANDPNVGYSKTAGRFGDRVDSNGHRYFDCSGLVFAAYQHAGITLGGNWTGAMRSNWPQWADQVPKDPAQMKAGDLILMDGHVVMYIGGGKCVGAQTSHTDFQDQVTADIDVNHYLARPDAMVLRPRV